MKREQRAVFLALVMVAAMAGAAIWTSTRPRGDGQVQRSINPIVMGTTSTLTAVGPPERVDGALRAARDELEAINRLASTYDSTSQVSRFNAAPAGVEFPLDPALLEVMRVAARFSERTGGAFDITMRPLTLLWKRAAKADRTPTTAEIDSVRGLVGWTRLVIGDSGATREAAGMEITLDAIVKGYAVDRALTALREARMSAGMVEVGGDLACFGRPIDDRSWRVGIQSPWAEQSLGTIEVPGPDAASAGLCSSGNYRRFVTVQGIRRSHIIDPRTGQPADAVPSVTVIAPDAMRADAWATSLSVLSIDEGLRLVEADQTIAAMWLTGSAEHPEMVSSTRFKAYLRESAAGVSNVSR